MTNSDLVAINESDESDGDQKPAAKLSGSTKNKPGSAKGGACISLLEDSSDEENYGMSIQRKRRTRDEGAVDRELTKRLPRAERKTPPTAARACKIFTPNSPSWKKRRREDEVADRNLAKELQRTETISKSNSPSWKKRSRERETADRKLAKELQRAERKEARVSRSSSADRELAQKLQRMEDEATRKASLTKERSLMAKSSDGKAVLAVQEIIALVKTSKQQFIDSNPALLRYSVETVTIDDMVFMAKNMLEKQKEFIDEQRPGHIGMSRW